MFPKDVLNLPLFLVFLIRKNRVNSKKIIFRNQLEIEKKNIFLNVTYIIKQFLLFLVKYVIRLHFIRGIKKLKLGLGKEFSSDII